MKKNGDEKSFDTFPLKLAKRVSCTVGCALLTRETKIFLNPKNKKIMSKVKGKSC
jgi:hypothetical protein